MLETLMVILQRYLLELDGDINEASLDKIDLSSITADTTVQVEAGTGMAAINADGDTATLMLDMTSSRLVTEMTNDWFWNNI